MERVSVIGTLIIRQENLSRHRSITGNFWSGREVMVLGLEGLSSRRDAADRKMLAESPITQE